LYLRLVAVFLGLQVASCAVPPPSVAPLQSLKLVSWNLEHLAEKDGTGCRPRTEADYAALRDHVRKIDADVIAFQEVENPAAAARVFDPSVYTVVMSGRPASRRGGECRGQPGLTILNQDLGFAIRRSVAWRRNPDLTSLGLGNPDLRWGVDITLEGAHSLRLLAVHLKSGCSAGDNLADPDCPVLFDQAPIMAQWIRARSTSADPFIILGDWNRRLALPADAFMATLTRADGASLALASGTDRARCKQRYPDYIDHIVSGGAATARIRPGSFQEYRYGVAENEHPSDHCPISVELRD
jgi:endonuclease/exonuclease/phosphatase family metal-dependent hydrolase